MITNIDPHKPVVIAGPTASGKSALALDIVAQQGGIILNADAIQVFDNWRILTARPSVEDEAAAPHALYGHIAGNAPYSVGHWLRDITPYLSGDLRPVIVGGTGLYLTALTVGLANIPPTPPEIRADANALMETGGISALLADIDPTTQERIDVKNPMRVQRAYEVQKTTGLGLAHWQDNTPPPLLPLAGCTAIVVDAPKPWLTPRIDARFDHMLALGALDEARENLATWSPADLSAKAIGAPELIAHLKGEISLEKARRLATIATHQFAKRQRTWFRARMSSWQKFTPNTAQ